MCLLSSIGIANGFPEFFFDQDLGVYLLEFTFFADEICKAQKENEGRTWYIQKVSAMFNIATLYSEYVEIPGPWATGQTL